MSPGVWTQFYSWYDQRKEDHRPHHTQTGIWIVTDEFVKVDGCAGTERFPGLPALPGTWPRLIAGCCLYPANGPYVICEFVSTNPDAPARLRHLACEKIGWAIRAFGAMHGQNPMTFPKHKGVKRLLEKAGFQLVQPGVEVMWAMQFAPVHFEPGKVAEISSATMEAAE